MKQARVVAAITILKSAVVGVDDNFNEEAKEKLAEAFINDLKRNFNSIEEEILSVEVIE